VRTITVTVSIPLATNGRPHHEEVDITVKEDEAPSRSKDSLFALRCDCCGHTNEIRPESLCRTAQGSWLVVCDQCGCPTEFRTNPFR